MRSLDNLSRRVDRMKKKLEKQERIITINDAAIATATIEIKAIQVNNKQMTLAVFRQLMSESIFDEGGNLQGTPWGWVNYHASMYCDYYYSVYPDSQGRHLHIVWQKGDQLRTCSVIYTRVPEQAYRQLEQLDQLFIAV